VGDSNNPLINLHGEAYFSWSRFHGNITAHIREYFRNKTGDIIPTKRGISMNKKGYDELKRIIHSAVLIKAAAGLDTPQQPDKRGLDPAVLVPAIAMSVYERIAYQRFACCLACNPGIYRGPAGHSCLLSKTSLPTDHELDCALERARKMKAVEAELLASDEVTLKQYIALDFSSFYSEFDGKIRAQVRELYLKTDAFVGYRFPEFVL